VTSHHPIRKVVPPEPTVIPDKLYFRIGDVAKLCDVPTYVLRFWETEFPQLKPNKGGTGQRLYRKRDVEMALRIKTLLYDQGYTIPGARQVFSTESKAKDAPETAPQLVAPPPPPPPPPTEAAPAVDLGETIRQQAQRREQISSLRAQLRSLAEILTQPASPQHPDHPAPAAVTPAAEAPAANPKSLRPRLVLEPRPDARPDLKPDSTPDAKPTPRLLDQRDLFPSE
jgi:DNA-binding transcriptional MerR regulator